MIGHAGCPTGIVHADMTLIRSKVKVKVKVTGRLNFRQLAKPCMLMAMTAAPCGAFWFHLHAVYRCFVVNKRFQRTTGWKCPGLDPVYTIAWRRVVKV